MQLGKKSINTIKKNFSKSRFQMINYKKHLKKLMKKQKQKIKKKITATFLIKLHPVSRQHQRSSSLST